MPSSITSILFGSGSAAAAASKLGNGSSKSEAASGQRDPRKKPVGATAQNPEKTGSSKKSSTLGSMSEADLLAAAAAQMDDIPPLPPMIG